MKSGRLQVSFTAEEEKRLLLFGSKSVWSSRQERRRKNKLKPPSTFKTSCH